MTDINIKNLQFKCVRCNHQWIIRKPTKPKICPRCKLPWDKKGKQTKSQCCHNCLCLKKHNKELQTSPHTHEPKA